MDADSSHPLRVALVSELFYPSVGGQQTRFEEMGKALVRMGHRVDVICVKDTRGAPALEEYGGLRVRRGPNIPNYERPIFGLTWVRRYLQRSVLGMIRYSFHIRRVLRHEHFDIVYFNQWPFLPILLAPRHVRRRAWVDWCEFRSGLPYRLPQRYIPAMVTKNTCVNPRTATRLKAVSGTDFCYLPTGVDIAKCGCQPSERRGGLLFLGRLVDNKNIPLLIAGWRLYRSNGGDEPLFIAGTGPLHAKLEEYVKALPSELRSAVSLLGPIGAERKYQLLASVRALVIPSKREGFPNVVAEAMASGTPTVTVAARHNDAAAIVELYDVGVVGPDTPIGLADAIKGTLTGWEHFSSAAKRAAPQLSWDRIAGDLMSAWRRPETPNCEGGTIVG